MNDNSGDTGWAAKVNGVILLRTASDTDWQAMGNALCLVFGYTPSNLWIEKEIVDLFRSECLQSEDDVKIVRCFAVEVLDDQPNMGHGDDRVGEASAGS